MVVPLHHLFGIAAVVALAGAQVPHGGSPRSFGEASVSDKTAVIAANPTEDIAALIAADGSAGNGTKHRKDEAGGRRIGVVVDVNADLSQFSADTLADGSVVHRLTVRSAGALGMGINFHRYQLPAGAELYVYSGDKKVVRGAFTDWNHKPKGNFAVTPVPGDVLVVEVVVPVAAAAKPIAVVVGSIVHHYIGTRLTGSHGATHPSVAGRARRQDSDFGDSGACNVNSKCPVARGYENAARGIAMVLDSDGDRFCSGSMINNVEQDGKQFFLTADHCMEDEDGDTCIVLFNYESDECANPRTEPSTADTAQGMRPVASNGYSDFSLHEILERIPEKYDVYLNGFDATADNSFTKPFSISHPSGDIKKVASYGGMAAPEGYFEDGDSHWLIAEWDQGVTEGGSSGSPIFDTQGRIRGQLHGGYADCDYLYVDYYGRISKSWDFATGVTKQLSAWLDPQRTGTRVVDGGGLNEIKAAHAAKSTNNGTIAR